MIRIEDLRVVAAAARVNTHEPWLVEYLQAARLHELNALAYKPDDVPLRCGRIQMLDEVIKMFTNAGVDLRRTQA